MKLDLRKIGKVVSKLTSYEKWRKWNKDLFSPYHMFTVPHCPFLTPVRNKALTFLNN